MEHPNSPKTQEENFFNEEDFSTEQYEKHIRNARNAIFVVAAVELLFGIYTIYTSPKANGIEVFIFILIPAIFFMLGLWTRKKPYTAILIALIFYGSLIVLDAIVEPSQIIKGLLVKILIIAYLIRGLGNARDAQRWKETFGIK